MPEVKEAPHRFQEQHGVNFANIWLSGTALRSDPIYRIEAQVQILAHNLGNLVTAASQAKSLIECIRGFCSEEEVPAVECRGRYGPIAAPGQSTQPMRHCKAWHCRRVITYITLMLGRYILSPV